MVSGSARECLSAIVGDSEFMCAGDWARRSVERANVECLHLRARCGLRLG